MDGENIVEPNDEILPSEYRIIRWDDGDHIISEVYLKDGKPWSYETAFEQWGCGKTFDGLRVQLAEMQAAFAYALSLPVLNEATDFPGELRALPMWPPLREQLAKLKTGTAD